MKLQACAFEEDFTFNKIELTDTESAFLNYYHIKFGDPLRARDYIDQNATGLVMKLDCFHASCYWLWILGGYINKTRDVEYLKSHDKTVDAAIAVVDRFWRKELPNWILKEQTGCYISNLAIAYGALQAISNHSKSEARRIMLEIKRALFKEFMDGGRVVSHTDKTMTGDLSLIAVPFGLLDAGNQILVESIRLLEEQLISEQELVCYKVGETAREDLALLLSWYYTERGEIARAQKLKTAVENVRNKSEDADGGGRLTEILYSITAADLREKQFSMMDQDKMQIHLRHVPCGYQNPYRKEIYERLPNHPIEGEEVVLNLLVQPVTEKTSAYVVYRVNGMENAAAMKLHTTDRGEVYFSYGIGQFQYQDKVEYSFVVEDQTKVISDSYSFRVRKWQSIGNLISVQQDNDSLSLYFDGMKNRMKGIHLRFVADGNRMKLDFSVVNWEETKSGMLENTSLTCRAFSLSLDMDSMSIRLHTPKGAEFLHYDIPRLFEILSDGSGEIFSLRMCFPVADHEKFYGMGERFSAYEYRGLVLDNYVYNQYRDQGLRSYIPMPFMISSGGYGLYLQSSRYAIFRFDPLKKGFVEIEAEMASDNRSGSQSLCFHLFAGTPKQILPSFTKLTGEMKPVPKWALGPWMSSNNWDNQDEVMKQVNLTKLHQIPATVLVLEQWSDEATFYIFNDASYQLKDGKTALVYGDFKFEPWGRWPDPRKMVEELHQQNLKVLLWQTSVMKYMDGLSHAQRDEDERAMLELGYHVKTMEGRPYRIPYYEWFKGSLVPDFTNREAAAWWMSKRDYLIRDIGIDGFKTDGGECIYGRDALFFDGRTGEEMRNQYPIEYEKTYYDYMNEPGKAGGITFSRAGYTGAQGVPMHWAGDERSTFEAFRASIIAGLSSGLSGILFWGWDLGGFNGEIPTAELYTRATEMAAFCPVMQYHAETKGEFCRDRTPWNIAERTSNPAVIDIFRKYANLRMNLLPYIYHQAILSIDEGIPMMRAMIIEYPEDLECRSMTFQYFFGDALLAAPVTDEGKRDKSVYLPKGKWWALFEDRKYTGGGYLMVKAELDEIPVFVKENSVIPLNLNHRLELCSDVGSAVDSYVNLTFLIYLENSIHYEFRDDLGNQINIQAIFSNERVKIDIEGMNQGGLNLILVGISSASTMVVNGIEDYSYVVRNDKIYIGL